MMRKSLHQYLWILLSLTFILSPVAATFSIENILSWFNNDDVNTQKTSLKPRRPLAFLVSGGGFRTMTIGISMARAMSQAFDEAGQSWEDVTHIGCNSGGNWFVVPFIYSQELFDDVTKKKEQGCLGFQTGNDYRPLKDIIEEYGRNYQNIGRSCMDRDGDRSSDDDGDQTQPQCNVGILGFDAADFVDAITKLLNVVDLGSYITNWQEYVNEMLRPYLPDIDTLTYADPRPALPHATLIQQLALPPDAWVNKPDESGANNQQVHIPTAYSTYPFDPIMLPFAHVSKSQKAPAGLVLNGYFSPYFGSIIPLKGNKGEDGSGSDQIVNATFTDVSKTKVAEVAAISSSAYGALGSPTLLRIVLAELIEILQECLPTACLEERRALVRLLGGSIDADSFVDILLQELNTGRDVPGIVDDILQCLPNGIEGTAPAITLEPAQDNQQLPWSPSFRGVDGGYTENSVIHSTIATFIRDCENGDASLQCENKIIDIVLVDDGLLHAFATQCFFDNSGLNNTCRPAGERMKRHLFWDIPSIQIFRERFPTNWTQYVPRHKWTPEYLPEAVRLQSIISYIQGNFDGSHWTSGTFNTVDNFAYGVKAGYKARLLIFEINSPISLNPILLPPTAAEISFSAFYTEIVQDQADGMLPIITQWLRREI